MKRLIVFLSLILSTQVLAQNQDGSYLVGAVLAVGSDYQFLNPLNNSRILEENSTHIMSDIIQHNKVCKEDLHALYTARANGTAEPVLNSLTILKVLKQLVNIYQPSNEDYQAQLQMSRNLRSYLQVNANSEAADCENGPLGRNMPMDNYYDSGSPRAARIKYCQPFHEALNCLGELSRVMRP